MSGRDEELLAKELEKVAAESGKIAAKITGDSNLSKASGSFGGIRKAAKRLDTEQCLEEITMEGDPKSVLRKVYDALHSIGRILEENERESSKDPRISGVVGSGFLGKNPALVHAEIVEVEEGRCTLRITASAKEGLIKQGTAEKAVGKLVRELDAGG